MELISSNPSNNTFKYYFKKKKQVLSGKDPDKNAMKYTGRQVFA